METIGLPVDPPPLALSPKAFRNRTSQFYDSARLSFPQRRALGNFLASAGSNQIAKSTIRVGAQDKGLGAAKGDIPSLTKPCAAARDLAAVPSFWRIKRKTSKFCGTAPYFSPPFAIMRDGLLRTGLEVWLALKTPENRRFLTRPPARLEKRWR